MLVQILKDFYMSHDTLLKIEDMTQDQKAEVMILHKDEKDFDKDVVRSAHQSPCCLMRSVFRTPGCFTCQHYPPKQPRSSTPNN